MSGLGNEVTDAPDPDRVPSPSQVRVAYTDLEREKRVEVGARTLYEARVPTRTGRMAVLLEEFDARSATGATVTRGLGTAVQRWRSVEDHDHAAAVVDWGKKPRPWIASEAATGGTLASLTGEVDLPFALWTGVCAAEALSYAHEAGVEHLSLAPSTVRLRPVPDHWPVPRVADWAVGRWRTEHVPTDAESARTRYLAPEQHDPDRFAPPGLHTDVYGLGIVLYELLTGELPHVTDVPPRRAVLEAAPIPPSTVDPTLPSDVDDVLLDALASDPADRIDLASFRSHLATLLAAEVGGSDPPSESSDSGALPTAFPLFDGNRAQWTADCPTCGASINNTVASFVAHWRDCSRCDGPPRDPPSRLANCTPDEWRRIVAYVEAVRRESEVRNRAPPDHPLLSALAADDRQVVEVGGVRVDTADGTFPWLDCPRRGWRVPCPSCGASVFNAAGSLRSHWRDAAGCEGPPDDFRTV